MLTATARQQTRQFPASRPQLLSRPCEQWAEGQPEVTRVERALPRTSSSRPGFLMALLRAFSAFGA